VAARSLSKSGRADGVDRPLSLALLHRHSGTPIGPSTCPPAAGLRGKCGCNADLTILAKLSRALVRARATARRGA
jgi:hypothetical protein